MKLYEKITALRKKSGLSQEELAIKMDISRQAVSKWESGQTVPDLSRIMQLSEIFNVSTDYLLKDEESERQNNISNSAQKKRQIADNVFVAYCGIILVIYFLWSIFSQKWNITWIVFVAGGIFIPLLSAICDWFVNKKN